MRRYENAEKLQSQSELTSLIDKAGSAIVSTANTYTLFTHDLFITLKTPIQFK